MNKNYELALNFLDDFNVVTESSFRDLGPKKSNSRIILDKFEKMCSKIAKGLWVLVDTLINAIRQLTDTVLHKIKVAPRNMILVDRYGYVDAICKASIIIDDYYTSLINLYELDAEINKAMSVMDDVKDKLSNSTIRFVKNDESKLQQEIKVKKNFDNINNHITELESILDGVLNNPVEFSKPKRYTINNLDSIISHNLSSKKTQLEELKYTLEVAQRVYEDRSWIYKKVHSNDIIRNRDILNATSALLLKIEDYKNLYVRLIAQFD